MIFKFLRIFLSFCRWKPFSAHIPPLDEDCNCWYFISVPFQEFYTVGGDTECFAESLNTYRDSLGQMSFGQNIVNNDTFTACAHEKHPQCVQMSYKRCIGQYLTWMWWKLRIQINESSVFNVLRTCYLKMDQQCFPLYRNKRRNRNRNRTLRISEHRFSYPVQHMIQRSSAPQLWVTW